ncbi:hypothetical protein [Herbaspirillum rhizosphaerae]|uniref:hypothetical protein n=1 Tax=Herbaspirillum rhizosphaerae TaxID=346179 RepID=UPI000B1E91BA|nr:hypothetical protein [Herbaspirillum rhizosphaerae]
MMMKQLFPALFLASAATVLLPQAAAQTAAAAATPTADPSCDCQQPVGACSASIAVKPVEATTLGSYAAELKFTSSAPACSKINYYVDGTPYFNVLVSGNTGTDNLWGPKQISRANITEISCQVCKQVSITPIPQDKKPVKSELSPGLFDGQWAGAGNNSFGSAQRWTLSFATTAAGQAAITGTMEGNFPTVPISASGTVSGSVLSWKDQQTLCSASLLTDVSLAFECHGQGSVQMVMKRQ